MARLVLLLLAIQFNAAESVNEALKVHRSFRNGFSAAYNEHNFDKAVSFYASNASLINYRKISEDPSLQVEETSEMRGHKDLKVFFENEKRRGAKEVSFWNGEEEFEADDAIRAWGIIQLEMKTEYREEGRYEILFQKTEDTTWLVAEEWTNITRTN